MGMAVLAFVLGGAELMLSANYRDTSWAVESFFFGVLFFFSAFKLRRVYKIRYLN